jgi:hypothetical protein
MARELIPKLFETARQLSVGGSFRGRPRVHDNINTWQPKQIKSKRFSNHPFDAIPTYRVTDGFG